MTTNPTEAQMKLARECAIEHRAAAWTDQRYDDSVNAAYRNGALDDDMRVQVTLLAIKATEARAQGLVELLEMMDGIGYKELNLSNYTHDDVCALNNAYVEMQLILTQALATWRRT